MTFAVFTLGGVSTRGPEGDGAGGIAAAGREAGGSGTGGITTVFVGGDGPAIFCIGGGMSGGFLFCRVVKFGTGIRRRVCNFTPFFAEKGDTGVFARATFGALFSCGLVMAGELRPSADTVGLNGASFPASTAFSPKFGVCTITESISLVKPPDTPGGVFGCGGAIGATVRRFETRGVGFKAGFWEIWGGRFLGGN